MKNLDFYVRPHRAVRLLTCAAMVLAITGCGALKDQYAASADAQQRAAAEAAADNRAGAAIDTRSTYLKLVEQMQKEGLWFASLAHIDALEQRWGVSPESTRMRADALRQTGQASSSEQAYRRLIGTSLESAGYRGLGLLAGARGNFAEAVQLLKQAQRLTPTDAALVGDLGYASLRAGQIADARLPLMQALQLRPDSAQAQSNLALYLEITDQSEQADKLMEANRMSPAARAAVREAARQLRAGGVVHPATTAPLRPPVATVAPLPSTTSREDLAQQPLMLKASRWSDNGGIRTASQLNPAAADTAASPSPNSSSRGTP